MGNFSQTPANLVRRIIKVKKKIEYKDINLDRIIRAAILHDIGKSEKRINIIQKTIMVLFGRMIKGYTHIEFIDSFYNHAELGYNILKNNIEDEKLLFLIRNHHKKFLYDIELNLLKYCDDKN